MIQLKELINIADEKIYEFFYELVEVVDNPFIRAIENCDGYFVFYYDESEHLKVEYKMVGQMICPDAFTLEDVVVPFELEEIEDVVTDMAEEGLYLENKTDEMSLIRQIVLPIVPIKVVKNENKEYARGDGWSILKEEDLEYHDPRLDEFKKLGSKEEE